MSAKKLIIFGTSEIAQLAFYYFNTSDTYQVVGFALDTKYIKSDDLYGVPILPAETLEESHPPGEVDVFVGASYSNMNKNRAAIYNRIKSWGYKLASYISPRATVASQDIGENVLIMEHVSIALSVKIGNNVVIGPNAMIAHDTTINDHIYIAPSTCFCGYNVVDDYSVIGASATIAPRVHIGKSNFIGIGTLIFDSTGEDEAYLTHATKKTKMRASSAWTIGLIK